MTAIRPADSALRDKIKPDDYNGALSEINVKYAEMEKYIGNLQSDVTAIADFGKSVRDDMERGYDVGTSLDTLKFQEESLQIDLDFFVHMKEVYTKKLYGDLYSFCSEIISSAMAIETIPSGGTVESVRERKFQGATPYPPPLIPNPAAKDAEGNPVEGQPEAIPDPYAKYDMNGIFALINITTSNLRELADDINSFTDRIAQAQQREARGFAVGNLIMNMQAQQQKLTLEFDASISRINKFLEQNKSFSARCLKRIQLISSEIVTAEEVASEEGGT